MACIKKKEISNQTFQYWWEVKGAWVEEPNYRRSGWSGVINVEIDGKCYYIKRQCNHLCRTLQHPFGYPTAAREWYYLHRLRKLGINTPTPVYFGDNKHKEGHQAVIVTEELKNYFPLSSLFQLDDKENMKVAEELGKVLGILHKANLQHTCLYDKHVMVNIETNTPQIALIDLEKMRRRLSAHYAAKRDLDQLYRHQDIFNQEVWSQLIKIHAQYFTASR